MVEFKLSASMRGHDDDVRAVAFPMPDLVVSASRDASVRTWKLLDPPKYEDSIAATGQSFMNAVTFLRPTKEYSRGLVISGGKDSIVDVRELGTPSDAIAERLLLGHEHNVCALDVSPDLKWIVSGSWDTTARVWNVSDWDCVAILEGHQGSVWSVLAYDNERIITDKLIRIYDRSGKHLHSIEGSNDVVRALCKLPDNHPSGAHLASAGNDGAITLWKLSGQKVLQLTGHESFIYSLGCLASGEIVSSGEDRTVRVWRGSICVQTITLPAISVWSVAVNHETGDIATGSSDRVVRVFTRDAKRFADAETLSTFEDSVKSSAIPQQQMGEANKEKLPGPDFLIRKSGTKEGQVAMIREDNGSITAHTWSAAAQQWVNVGTVVDSAASSGQKTEHLGKDYDYVFDVDIEDGKPPLKLPYNLSQNPYEAATAFIQDNELPMNYLDQVADFITKNTQGATFGPRNPSASADPLGTEARYRPGERNDSEPRPPLAKKVLPQMEYLSITTANIKVIMKKISELNEKLLDEGLKEKTLNPPQLESLQDLAVKLEQQPIGITSGHQGLISLSHILTSWPVASQLPGLDLLRLLTAALPFIADQTPISLLTSSGALTDADRPNNQMLAVRALANLYNTPAGQKLAAASFDQIHTLVKPLWNIAGNRNLTVALGTLYINMAVQCVQQLRADQSSAGPEVAGHGLTLAEDLCSLLKREKDSEAIYRALVALGTLLTLGEEVRQGAKEVFGIQECLIRAESGVKEPRIKSIVREIRETLNT